jgi:hypothetical protein
MSVFKHDEQPRILSKVRFDLLQCRAYTALRELNHAHSFQHFRSGDNVVPWNENPFMSRYSFCSLRDARIRQKPSP